jgi:hypothetical protein
MEVSATILFSPIRRVPEPQNRITFIYVTEGGVTNDRESSHHGSYQLVGTQVHQQENE